MNNKKITEINNNDVTKYNKVSQREHILIRSDTYIGSIQPITENMWIYNNNLIVKEQITFCPGLLKVFDEILVNAGDASTNDKTCDTIKVEYNKEDGYISVFNNGDTGIPIEEHPSFKMLVPTMIFGELLTSSNYNDNEERTTGGRNGYGAKLANIFSTKFIVEIDDAKRHKRYKQTWLNNMLSVEEPIISKLPAKTKSSVKITFYPDFEKFNIKELDDDHLKLFHRRTIDIAGTNNNKLKVFFNDEKIICSNFKSYIELYYPSEDNEIYLDNSNERWNIGVIYKPNNGGEVISFVNSIFTYNGGTHCNYVIDNIIKILINDYIKKDKDIKKKELKISNNLLKENLIFFINSTIINPAFSSQTKDVLTTKSDKFGSKYEISQTFLKKLVKCGIIKQIIDSTKLKENSTLKKTDGKKQNKIYGIPKLEDANKAGTKDSSNCTLILTEGDSAKATAMAGLGVIGRDYYGVFPLKGKLLNVREATPSTILNNEEITNLKTILGLKQGEDYSSILKFNNLRYGHVLLLTDQDSVTGDTPLLLKLNDNIVIKNIEDITTQWTQHHNKEISTTNYLIWTDKEWVRINKVIRHLVTKKMYRVITDCGCVDVTEDHSLINNNLEKITPNNCKINDELLHYDLIYNNNPNINNNLDSQINEIYVMGIFFMCGECDININLWYIEHDNLILLNRIKTILYDIYGFEIKINENILTIINPSKQFINKYYILFYNKNKYKIIPDQILNNNLKIKESFISGINNIYNFDNHSFITSINNLIIYIKFKITAQCLYYLYTNLNYYVIIDYDINCSKYILHISQTFICKNYKIKKIIDLGNTNLYVYDLETVNHHFQAGIGQMIVHNTDGCHIKGLFINFLHSLWPSLVKYEGFVQSLNTPIIKAFKNKEIQIFYNLTEYDTWKTNTNTNNWKIKYYKGLGTSTAAEAKEYFIDINTKLITYYWNNLKLEVDPDNDAITLAFEKNRSDDRKSWLMKYDKNNILKYENKKIQYYDFIHSDLIHFSNDDLIRSIPSVIDGFKPSQRKILYGAFLRGLDKDEVKVAQLAGFVSDRAAYHHGEASLNGAIIGMAQNFIGSNNINILMPNGQFGTRLQGGNDAASPRYIWTMLEELTTIIYNPLDEPILNHQTDDGIPIEPEYYIPIIPMILVNGTAGIGTGFSTKIPPYNPLDIIDNLKLLIKNKPLNKMDPWWQGFKGTVNKIDDTNYEITGCYEIIDNNKIIITELPVGTWTSAYKEFLEKLLSDDNIKKDSKKNKKENPFLGYKDNNTDSIIHFELTFDNNYLINKDINKLLHLSKKYSINNMHLYSSNGYIKKYDDINEIMKDYYDVRLKLYDDRKKYQLEILEYQLELISFKVKFILLVINKKLNINNKKKIDIENELLELEFKKLGKSKNDLNNLSFDYLLSMPIYNLTFEKIEELKKQEKDKQIEYDNLKDKTIHDIWLDELNILETKYKKWFENKNNINNIKISKKKK